MGYFEVSNYEDIMDSCDVIDRIADLEHYCTGSNPDEVIHADFRGQDYIAEDETRELAALRDLARQGESASGDWAHGATLVRDSYFKEYAMDYADGVCAIDANANWPVSCIDWDQAASELQMDYTSIEFDGITYWVR